MKDGANTELSGTRDTLLRGASYSSRAKRAGIFGGGLAEDWMHQANEQALVSQRREDGLGSHHWGSKPI